MPLEWLNYGFVGVYKVGRKLTKVLGIGIMETDCGELSGQSKREKIFIIFVTIEWEMTLIRVKAF